MDHTKEFNGKFAIPSRDIPTRLNDIRHHDRTNEINSQLMKLHAANTIQFIETFCNIIEISYSALYEMGVYEESIDHILETIHSENMKANIDEFVAFYDRHGGKIIKYQDIERNEDRIKKRISNILEVQTFTKRAIGAKKALCPNVIGCQHFVDVMIESRESKSITRETPFYVYGKVPESVRNELLSGITIIDLDQFFNSNEKECPVLKEYLSEVEISEAFHTNWQSTHWHSSGDSFIEYFSFVREYIKKNGSMVYIITGTEVLNYDITHQYETGQYIYFILEE